MGNNEFLELVNSFKEYRALLEPVEQSLQDFSLTFEKMKNDIQTLNANFNSDLNGKLDRIYKDLSVQSEKSKMLAGGIDKFAVETAKYLSSVDRLLDIMSKIENRVRTVDEIEKKAEDQIGKLNSIIEEKKKTYDIKQLEKNLENYNVGVQKVSEYINQDIAENLKQNNETIRQIRDKSDSVFESLKEEKLSIEKLVENYQESNKLLKKVVENNDVNEEYIFEILDKWALDRKVKTRK